MGPLNVYNYALNNTIELYAHQQPVDACNAEIPEGE